MSTVRFRPNINRLGSRISLPGGKLISDAVQDADDALQQIRPPGLERIDEALNEIDALLAPRGPLAPETLEAVYRLADEINAIADPFGLPDLSRAAWSLCEFIDRGGNDPAVRGGALAHAQSLRLLRSGPALSDAEREAVLAALDRLVAHFKPPPEAKDS